MRTAVIGLAGVGNVHVNRWEDMPEVELVAVCDTDQRTLESVAAKHDVKGYPSAEELIDSERLDAISICTPPKSHLPLTRLAAEHGVHVLCEKPMASHVEDCHRMIGVCEANRVTLMIGHKKRFVPPLVKLKELVDGELGPIQYMIHRYPHPGMSNRDWFWAEDDGGGPILENAVHAADILGYLMGDVERVYAEGDTFFATDRRPQIDCAVYTLRFSDGAIATVGAGMVSMGSFSFEDFYVSNTTGVAEISGPFDNANRLRYGFRADPGDVTEERYEDADPFRLEMEHFLECVQTGAVPRASGEAGMKAVAVCRAVKRSAETGKPVAVRYE